jgi:hypothetical protein
MIIRINYSTQRETMSDVDDLRERLVGQRFYDQEQDESFTVVGITEHPPLALLQYDDGIAWDEGASNFTVSENVAHLSNLDEDGLDSDRYRPLGSGPRLDEICDSGTHKWHPMPDDIWPSGPPEEMKSNPRDLYNRFVRCKRCGLSGEVVIDFGVYGNRSEEIGAPPWFCTRCGDAYANTDLVFRRDSLYCRDCSIDLDGVETGDS